MEFLRVFALILAQAIRVEVDGHSTEIQVIPSMEYVECVGVVTGTWTRHLYCVNGDVMFTLSPGQGEGLSGCTVIPIDDLRRRIDCVNGRVRVGYTREFIFQGSGHS